MAISILQKRFVTTLAACRLCGNLLHWTEANNPQFYSTSVRVECSSCMYAVQREITDQLISQADPNVIGHLLRSMVREMNDWAQNHAFPKKTVNKEVFEPSDNTYPPDELDEWS